MDSHVRRPFPCEGRLRRHARGSIPFCDGGDWAGDPVPEGEYYPLQLAVYVPRGEICWEVTLDQTVVIVEGVPYSQEWWSNVIWCVNYLLDEGVHDRG